MDCEICSWTGNSRGYSQHCSSEKHISKCEISRLKKRIDELQKENAELQILKTLFYKTSGLPMPTDPPKIDQSKLSQYENDKSEILYFLKKLNCGNWEILLEPLSTDSLQIMKFKDVFRNDYSFYNDSTYGVRFDNNQITYGRLVLLDDVPPLPRIELTKYKWYTTATTQLKLDNYLMNDSSNSQILELFDTIDKHNWDELTTIHQSDDERITNIKKLLRNDFEEYGYTTIVHHLFDQTIKYTRSKGCGREESNTFF
jgi:hypothetical protein